MVTIIVHPGFDALYYSFYVEGIIRLFGESSIEFSAGEFPPLSSSYLGFIVKSERDFRVIIDAYDGARMTNNVALDWCDVYAKVNLASEIVPKKHAHKCLPIGPSFPVQVWSFPKTWWIAFRNYRPSAQGLKSTLDHFANYRRQYKYRLPLKHFIPGLSRDDYVFFSSSIWKDEEAPGTNHYRALFIESCRLLKNINFEGGFSPGRKYPEAEKYKHLVVSKRYPFAEWLEKIKLSAIVFNTPAVWLSHAWKIAEFLALGKAIISVPIVRELPAPLVHGEHIHYVDGSPESFPEAINSILTNRDYRMYLERNAYQYYIAFLTPERVIERVLEHHCDNRLAISEPPDSQARTRRQVVRTNTLTARSLPSTLFSI